MSFLEDRHLQIKYKGAMSSLRRMPGGGPQGTILGMFIFIILIDPIEFTSNFNWGNQINTKLCKRKPIDNIHLKYVDDLTLAEAINLKLNTFQDDDNLNFPPNFHSRTGHKLINPPNMQSKLDKIQNYSDINDMKINTEKTKVMLFNKSTSIDFMPQLRLGSDEYLQVVEQMKLLGVTFTADLKWHKHVQNISKARFAKL